MAFSVDNKKIAINTIALYIRTILTMAISFFSARVTLQILGAEDYGLNNLLAGVVSLFSFLNASMGTAVQRFFNIAIGENNMDRLGKIYGVGLYLHIIIAIITFVIAEIFAVFFLSSLNIPSERMVAAHIVFQISVFSMVLNIVNVPNYALLKAREMFSKLATIEIVQALLRLGILYLLYIISYDKLVVLSALGFCVTLYYVISLFIATRNYQEAHHPICKDRTIIKEMIAFISMLIITVLAELFKTQGMVVLINLFFGLAINAAYAIAVQVSNMVSAFVLNIKQPMVPQMMAAYGAKDIKAMHTLIDYGTKITFLMMLLISMPIIFEIDWLLRIWLNQPPAHTSILVVLVLININVSSFTYFLYQGVHATGGITKQQLLMSSLFLLNVLFIFIGFKMGLSFTSAMYISILFSILQCIVNIIFSRIKYDYDIKRFILNTLFPSLILIVMVSIVLFSIISSMDSSFLRVVVSGVISTITICIGGYYLLFNKEEKTKIKNIVLSRIKR